MGTILITGMSGTGKSTVLAALADRGYSTVDTDYGDWIECSTGERLWRGERIEQLLRAGETSGATQFLGGTVLNQVDFYPRFADIVLLAAPLPVLLDRLAHRTNNTFGRTPAQRDRIIADTAEVEPLLRAAATVEIDTTRPLSVVVDRLVALTDRTASPERHLGRDGHEHRGEPQSP